MTLRLNGATNGSVSLDAPATGSDISLTLPGSVGTSGQLLSTDGSGVLSFVNGGKILQVVRATDTTSRTTTSTSFVDANLSVTITPQKSNSAIILISSYYAESATNDLTITVITDSSNNAISGAETVVAGDLAGTSKQNTIGLAYATPATTSATTYKLRFRTNTGGSCSLSNAVNTGQLFAIEVAA